MNRNLLLHAVTRIVTFIILIFSIYLFLAGHNNPGGGFIGGLMTASAILLLYITFDIKTVNNIIPQNYTYIIATGLLLVLGTGFIGVIFGYPFLTQFFGYYHLPILGKTKLNTALLFDLGIYLVVVGITLKIILSIAEDR